MVFAFREVLADEQWRRVERIVRVSFWGLNIGLALMVFLNMFPSGVLQLRDVLIHGYWHARGPEFLKQTLVRRIEWARLPGDAVFILFGVVPILIAAGLTYRYVTRQPCSIANTKEESSPCR